MVSKPRQCHETEVQIVQYRSQLVVIHILNNLAEVDRQHQFDGDVDVNQIGTEPVRRGRDTGDEPQVSESDRRQEWNCHQQPNTQAGNTVQPVTNHDWVVSVKAVDTRRSHEIDGGNITQAYCDGRVKVVHDDDRRRRQSDAS